MATKVKLPDQEEWSVSLDDNCVDKKPLVPRPVEKKKCFLSPNYVLGFFGVVTLIVASSSLYMYHSYRERIHQGSPSRTVLTPAFKWFDHNVRDPVRNWAEKDPVKNWAEKDPVKNWAEKDPVRNWAENEFGNQPAARRRVNEASNSFNTISGLRDGHRPVSVTGTPTPNTCGSVAVESRLDCHPQSGANEETCSRRGCCWSPRPADSMSSESRLSNSSESGLDIHAPGYRQAWTNLGTPACFYPAKFKNYNVRTIQSGKDRVIVLLEKNKDQESGYPDDVKEIMVEVTFLCNKRLRIRVVDRVNQRWEVPLPHLNLDRWPVSDEIAYNVHVSEGGVLTVTRKGNGVSLFNTDLTQIIFSHRFIQMTNLVPSKQLFGIGEHLDTFRKELNGFKRYTMLNTDQAPIKDAPLYGTHPFYLMAEPTTTTGQGSSPSVHGVLLFNNHPQDILLNPTPSVTYRTIGGVLDFFLFTGPTFDQVIEQNVQLTSRSKPLDGQVGLPPFWALGFHLCKYGYGSTEATRNATLRTRAAGIPIDVQWNDIDYMIKQNDFTYDPVNYKDLPQFVEELHSLGMHYIPIIDPAISGTEPKGTYAPLDDGLQLDIFVKNSTGDLFVGKVWNPLSSLFPDFTNPKTVGYWSKHLKLFHDQIPYDGLWLDMNEPSNMMDGQKDGCPNSVLDNPPYLPGGIKLSTKTLCMDAKHWIGNHYDVHNMYGIYENKISNEALKLILNKRPFIISRATVTGQGQWSNHWTGDVYSDWNSLRLSVSALFEFNSFGIPLVGADICGFNQDTTEELCSRWSSLGAFYPFSRNHNGLNERPQDPAFFGLNSTVASSARKSLLMRYSLLPYLYTLFYQHSQVGSPVIRPLFYEFPNDPDAMIETQFFWGDGVMIAPVLEQNVRQIPVYFPQGTWYDFSTLQPVRFSQLPSRYQSIGEKKNISLELDQIGVYIRAGCVISTQEPKLTTTEQRMGGFELILPLDKNASRIQAKGQLYWDDGDSLDSVILMKYTLVQFNVTNNVLVSEPLVTGYKEPKQNGDQPDVKVTKVKVLGTGKVTKVSLDGKEFKNWKSFDDRIEVQLDRTLLTRFELSWS